jgi:DNA polymerase elongation subunit (family B)
MEEYEILLNKNVQAAASFVRSSLMKLVDGDVPIEQLIISKTLRGSYVNPDSIAALAKRMRERDPGSAPQINDRVQYAFVVTDNPKALQADRVKTLSLSKRTNYPRLRLLHSPRSRNQSNTLLSGPRTSWR